MCDLLPCFCSQVTLSDKISRNRRERKGDRKKERLLISKTEIKTITIQSDSVHTYQPVSLRSLLLLSFWSVGL
jgi:hypothetical protein